MIHIYALVFVGNHVFEATKKSGTLENKKQKVQNHKDNLHIYKTLFQNQTDIQKNQNSLTN